MYNLIMKFLDGSPSFAHGYEMGMLHIRMQTGEVIDKTAVHCANREQIEILARSLICSAHNYELFWEYYDENWVWFAALPRHEPARKFKVVEGGLS